MNRSVGLRGSQPRQSIILYCEPLEEVSREDTVNEPLRSICDDTVSPCTLQKTRTEGEPGSDTMTTYHTPHVQTRTSLYLPDRAWAQRFPGPTIPTYHI